MEQDPYPSGSESDTKTKHGSLARALGSKLRARIEKFEFASPRNLAPALKSSTSTPVLTNIKRGILKTPSALGSGGPAPTTSVANQQFTFPAATAAATTKDPLSEVEPLQVYCRVKPESLDGGDGESCVIVKDPNTIIVRPPDSLPWTRAKEGSYSFNTIFTPTTSQKQVFDEVGRPLVRDLLDGKSSLLFAYGVTGSGKTYTMLGTPAEPGIMARALDVVFNSIGSRKAPKYSFKSDHMNGFEVQSKKDILLQRQLIKSSSQRSLRSGTPNGWGDKRQVQFTVTDSESEEEERSRDPGILPINNQTSAFSVFVTYTQIYNKIIYDLLDENVCLDLGKKTNCLQSKITRADAAGNMYVHNVVEVEVESAEEALQVLKLGQKKRKFGQTLLNSESSRSHSIFNIRLVQAPLNANGDEIEDDRSLIHVSQLSLVDLAGSERNNRTQTVGDRLREAGQINNSIMNLHKCLAALRKRQQRGGDGERVVIPYRDDKLTNFLKSYFEGQGRIRVLLCINPRAEDYAENLHVCNFAEQAQEIDILRQTIRIPEPSESRVLKGAPPPSKLPMRSDSLGLIGSIPSLNISQPLPCLRFKTPQEWREPLAELHLAVEERVDQKSKFRLGLLQMRTEFRNMLSGSDYELNSKRMELVSMVTKMKRGEGENEDMLGEIEKLKQEKVHLMGEKDDLEKGNDALVEEIAKCKVEYHHLELAQFQERARLMSDAEIERELDRIKSNRHRIQGEAKLKEEYKGRDKTIAAMKELVNQAESGRFQFRWCTRSNSWTRDRTGYDTESMSMSSCSESDWGLPMPMNSSRCETLVGTESGQRRHPARLISSVGLGIDRSDMAIANNRRSGSQSTNQGQWLEHLPNLPLTSNTVFQPLMKKKKSVNKLVNVEDLTRKTSKYCLRMDLQDSEGEVETQLYKGDVLQTVSGGAQMVFKDVEILKQVSPSRVCSPPSSGNRKRGSEHVDDVGGGEVHGGWSEELLAREELTAKCSTGLGNQGYAAHVQEKRSRQDLN